MSSTINKRVISITTTRIGCGQRCLRVHVRGAEGCRRLAFVASGRLAVVRTYNAPFLQHFVGARR